MTLRPILTCASLLGCAALFAVPAHAQNTFTVTATGHITSAVANYSDNPFDSTIATGIPFTYTFTWDKSVPVDTANSGALDTRWTTSSTFEGATVTLGDVTIGPSGHPDASGNPYDNFIQISDARTVNGKSYANSAYQQTSQPSVAGFVKPGEVYYTDITLSNSANPLLLNLSDPEADWSDPFMTKSIEIFYAGSGGTLLSVVGNIGSLTVSPEPSPFAVLGIGLAGLVGLGLTARRRKSLPEKAA